MGLEMLGLKKKVVHFSFRPCEFNSFSFGWPANLKKEGLFWCNYYSEEKFSKILDNILIIKQEDWLKELGLLKKNIINQDKDFGTKFSSIILKYI